MRGRRRLGQFCEIATVFSGDEPATIDDEVAAEAEGAQSSERSMVKLHEPVREIARHRSAAGGGRAIVENSAVGGSNGDGMIERAVKPVEAQLRVFRSALEALLRCRIDVGHPLVPWMAAQSRQGWEVEGRHVSVGP